VNGATCTNDGQDVSLYHCHCTEGYSGTNCQVPSYNKIACFNTDYKFLPDVLGDFRDLVNANKSEEVISACAELAFEKSYKFFALGYNGRCRSGPYAQDEYHSMSSAYDENCPNGIGIDKRIFVFTFEMLPKLVPLGCYVDKKSSRLLNIKFASFSNTYNASDPFATVVRCAHVARDKDYEYFAVQNFGVCRTDVNIVDNYDTYGEALSEKCVGGVGVSYTNFVYRLRPAVDGPNVCDTVPCQNGGLCVVHFSDPSRYYCQCGDWFTGDNCQDQIYPCDSNPCQNGATCNNDPNDISKYQCQCRDWFAGINCEVAQTICDTNNPCNNGGKCSSNTSSPAEYVCDCGDWFKGTNCEVQLYPCDSKPCVNGATCTNDPYDVSLYHCHCTEGYSGTNCQVPSFSRIACFNTYYNFLPDVLGDFREEVNQNKAVEVIDKCSELAFEKNYKFFALGYNGRCRSGPNARDEYHNKSSTSDANCPNGIGIDKRIVVYTFEFIPKIVPLGCYVEKKYDNRLLNIRFASFANMYNASDPHATVVKCAHLARDMDYEYFAVQNFGECRTDLNILDNYDTYGVAPPEKCVGGVGATLSNFVYRLRPAADGPNVCDTAPCQNGGTCVVHFNDPNRYYCECGDWFTGDNCQVQIYPCDSNPCQNGATCNNDANDISKYQCQCRDWFAGINCEVAQTICDTNNPCLNGRNCSSSFSSPAEYVCDCGDWFQGKNCEVQLYPCDSKPCVNGATCANDAHDVSLYHCHCTEGYSGTNCQVPSFSRIACFNTYDDFLPDVLGDFREEVKQNKAAEVISKCSELAFEKNYKFFALGYNGRCRSSPNARDEYHNKSSTSDANCPNGIGIDKRIVAYTFELLPKIVPLGCYVEKKRSSRVLNIKYASFANMYNASDPYATVVKCAHLARDMDYEYFAIQNFGDCRTDVNIVDNYDKHGEALPEKCVGGVGASLTNFVYRLRPAIDGPNVCDTTPCQNGGTCVVHFRDPNRYYCECGSLFTGGNCEIAVKK